MIFDQRIWDAIREARDKHGYNPTGFISMIGDYGVQEAVKRLVNSSKPSEGYTRLWELERLDLSVEAIILEEPWKTLYTDKEREKAKKRLVQYHYYFKE
jgi:hypothetical protein